MNELDLWRAPKGCQGMSNIHSAARREAKHLAGGEGRLKVPGPAEDPLGLHQALALGGGVGHRRGSAPREEGPATPEDQHEGGGSWAEGGGGRCLSNPEGSRWVGCTKEPSGLSGNRRVVRHGVTGKESEPGGKTTAASELWILTWETRWLREILTGEKMFQI